MNISIVSICTLLFGLAVLTRLLLRVRPGSLLSARILLFLRGIFTLENAADRLAAQYECAFPIGLQKISNHAIQSLDIAARFNSLIILLFRSYQNPKPRFP